MSPAVLFMIQIDATMKAFFYDAPEFNQAADFIFYRCTQRPVMARQPFVLADSATTACAIFRL
jgi:hypothetical protein